MYIFQHSFRNTLKEYGAFPVKATMLDCALSEFHAFCYESTSQAYSVFHNKPLDTFDDASQRCCVLLLKKKNNNKSHYGSHSQWEWLRAHVYSGVACAQLDKMDCRLAFSKITLFWLLQKMCHVAVATDFFLLTNWRLVFKFPAYLVHLWFSR